VKLATISFVGRTVYLRRRAAGLHVSPILVCK